MVLLIWKKFLKYLFKKDINIEEHQEENERQVSGHVLIRPKVCPVLSGQYSSTIRKVLESDADRTGVLSKKYWKLVCT